MAQFGYHAPLIKSYRVFFHRHRFDAVAEDRWEDAEKIRQQIAQLEKEADILKREIRLKLPRGLFLPVARTDLLELLTQQDKIANRAKDISGRMLGRKMEFPTEMRADFMAYLKRCIDATAQAEKAIGELDELLETGFKGREVEMAPAGSDRGRYRHHADRTAPTAASG